MWLRWLVAIEPFLINSLLRSPTFHRGVRAVHKRIHEVQHGKDLTELGGTKREGEKGLMQHFVDELKDQARGNRSNK